MRAAHPERVQERREIVRVPFTWGGAANTASAAGLLASLNSMPYGVTKHAAVAFAEWPDAKGC